MQVFSKGRLGPGATRGIVVLALCALAVAAALIGANPALSAGAECDRLRQAISEASRDNQGAKYQAAAERQRGEIDRTVAYAHSLGCENRKFLFFGSDPPPQCGQVNAQISRMRANLDDLQSRAGGGQGGRGELIARYNAQCGAGQQRTPGILDALFGQPKPADQLENLPLGPDPDAPPVEEKPSHLSEARAGGKAVCVRSCDGAFFPVSYSASGGRLDDLQDMCRALCPNADVTLYTYPTSGDIEQAVSITGARYMDSPTALKYRQSFDSTCSCKRRGESWAQALANAETKLGPGQKGDIMVTPEKSAELSRGKAPDPKTDPKAKTSKVSAKTDAAGKPTPDPAVVPKPAPGTDVNGVDTMLSQETQTISREPSGIAGADATSTSPVGENQGQTIESTGPGGVKRKVRIVGPTL
jgi:hypothetical protein